MMVTWQRLCFMMQMMEAVIIGARARARKIFFLFLLEIPNKKISLGERQTSKK